METRDAPTGSSSLKPSQPEPRAPLVGSHATAELLPDVTAAATAATAAVSEAVADLNSRVDTLTDLLVATAQQVLVGLPRGLPAHTTRRRPREGRQGQSGVRWGKAQAHGACGLAVDVIAGGGGGGAGDGGGEGGGGAHQHEPGTAMARAAEEGEDKDDVGGGWQRDADKAPWRAQRGHGFRVGSTVRHLPTGTRATVKNMSGPWLYLHFPGDGDGGPLKASRHADCALLGKVGSGSGGSRRPCLSEEGGGEEDEEDAFGDGGGTGDGGDDDDDDDDGHDDDFDDYDDGDGFAEYGFAGGYYHHPHPYRRSPASSKRARLEEGGGGDGVELATPGSWVNAVHALLSNPRGGTGGKPPPHSLDKGGGGGKLEEGGGEEEEEEEEEEEAEGEAKGLPGGGEDGVCLEGGFEDSACAALPWSACGTCFGVQDDLMEALGSGRFFRASSIKSFQRQLTEYGFYAVPGLRSAGSKTAWYTCDGLHKGISLADFITMCQRNRRERPSLVQRETRK